MLRLSFLAITLLSFGCAKEKKKDPQPVAKQTQGTEDQAPVEQTPVVVQEAADSVQNQINDSNMDLATLLKLASTLKDTLDLESNLDLDKVKALINTSGNVLVLTDAKKLEIRDFVTALKVIPSAQQDDVIDLIEATYNSRWVSSFIKILIDTLK
jgi:hypothetical protein